MPQSFINRTIDDQFGDSVSGVLPTYRPSAYWKPGTSCADCEVHADPAMAFDHTWRDSSQLPGQGGPVSLSLDFVGTAIQVFCIAPPIMTNVVTSYNLNFTLDGASRGTFSYSPNSSTEFVYNLSVVNLPSLPNEPHTLLISTDDSQDGSIFLFDYAVYTTVEDKPDADIGTIAGCVFGGILIILLALAFVLFKRRRQQRKSSPVLPVIQPFNVASEPKQQPSPPKNSESPVNSPAMLVHQFQQALDTVVTLRQTSGTPNLDPPPAVYIGESRDRYDTPPPVYQVHGTSGVL
ncbi:hypothetical protein B0H11DRAFT_935677 [Mycena galericulata]|nr:hypothetical protein B0H11DRAFT_935677 [Mycena galericulata]